MHTWIGYAHPDRLISYPHARYLSGYSLPIRVRVDAWELPTHGRGDQSQHLTAMLLKLCSGLQPGNRGTKLSLHAPNGPKCAYFGEQGEFCHGRSSAAAMPDEFRHAFSCTAAR